MSEIVQVQTSPFADQNPGTSGLRKKTAQFLKPNYLENFIQAIFDTLLEDNPAGFGDKTLVLGGDGRYLNRSAIQRIIKMAAAAGFGEVMVARGGILSTPAASAVIRETGAFGGFILSASHNPGGPQEDFGIKFNPASGAPAPQNFTDRVYARTKTISAYRTVKGQEVDIDSEGAGSVSTTRVTVFDPIAVYLKVMQRIFDFKALQDLFQRGFSMRFDAMNAVTGPYAKRILEDCLGAPAGTVVRATPLEDFGGCHPDPNLVHAHELVELMFSEDAPDFGAASDGDGDRNLILGRGIFVTPGDSLAIIAEHAAAAIPAYRAGLAGVARSMPTSRAVDQVARDLNIPCYETPTGWKFFCTLMDAGRCTICGEESFGTSSDHVREKDGLWAVLAWLSLIAASGKSVFEIVEQHWQRFGRSYFQRHDYESLDAEPAAALVSEVRSELPALVGRSFGPSEITQADDFDYVDPIDGSTAKSQGIRLFLADGARVVFRLSGTGTSGATLRVYLEAFRRDAGIGEVDTVLGPYGVAVAELLTLQRRFGRNRPDVVT